MYTKHFGLKSKPFQISSDPSFLWLGEKHKEALATLKYGVLDNKGFMLLTGDVGTGKTTLINALIQSLSDDILYASVTDPRLELMDFLKLIALAFDIQGEFSSKGNFLVLFKAFLERAYEQEKKVLLLIDESQLLTQDLLEEIRLLSNIQRDGNNLLNIFFVGQDEFNEILDSPENRAVAQRLTLNYHLGPLSEQETAEYIRHRLYVAGTKKKLFEPLAVREIHAYSGGFPRRINIICDHCLLNGFVKEKKNIDPEMVRRCAQDLKIPQYRKKHGVVPPQRPIPPQVEYQEPPREEAAASGKPLRGSSRNKKREKEPLTWPQAIMLCFGILLLLFFMAPETFTTKFEELRNIFTAQQSPAPNQQVESVDEGKPVIPAREKSAVIEPTPETEAKTLVAEKPASAAIESPMESTEIVAPPSEEQAPEKTPGNTSAVAETTPAQVLLPDTTSESAPAENQQQSVRSSVPEPVEPVSQVDNQTTVQAVDATVLEQTEVKDEQELVVEESSAGETAEETGLTGKTVMVRFDPDSSDFYFADIQHVDEFVEKIKQRPEVQVVISGHTDSYGSESYNYKLSLFRANMLKSFFLGKGISPEKVVVKGFGSTRPIASNDTAEGRKLNRRVEIDIIE